MQQLNPLAINHARLAPSVFLSASSHANDTAIGGTGAALVPLDETRVLMLREHILLSLDKPDSRWKVRARYLFQNLEDEPVRLRVGFPEHRCDPKMGWSAQPADLVTSARAPAGRFSACARWDERETMRAMDGGDSEG